MAKQLTVKEAKLVKAKVQGKTHKEAYAEAGYATTTDNGVAVNTNKILNKPHVQEALQAEMAKQGITLEAIIKPIKDGLEAEKVHIVGNGDQAMAEITPDHSIRLKSSQMAQTLLGANKSSDGGTTNNTFIQINNQQRDKYAD